MISEPQDQKPAELPVSNVFDPFRKEVKKEEEKIQ